MTDDTMEGLRALRDRVAKLTGPDREVDAQIRVILLHPAYRFPTPVLNRVPSNWAEARERLEWDGGGGSYPLPAYTASVDAVVALIGKVLPGWCYRLTGGGGEPAYAELFVQGAGIEHPQRDDDGPTPALALLNALLAVLAPTTEPTTNV
jgi:hypothetical protein